MTLNGRDHRIDFFRGLALIFIFWDHIPHNPLAEFTVRNFGFSDAAEIFVFLAGYAAVLAYGKILAREGFLITCVKILRRDWVLYVVHIFLLALLMGIVIFANSHIETRDLVQEMGLEYFLTHTQQALLDVNVQEQVLGVPRQVVPVGAEEPARAAVLEAAVGDEGPELGVGEFDVVQVDGRGPGGAWRRGLVGAGAVRRVRLRAGARPKSGLRRQMGWRPVALASGPGCAPAVGAVGRVGVAVRGSGRPVGRVRR